MYIEIFTEMFKMSQNNEELKNFFNCYIECLLLGYNTMIWSILDDNNLQFIEKFFNKLY